MLNRIVAIYPDGLVLANGVEGIYMSENLGKTWYKIMSRGRLDTVTRLSDNTFIYKIRDLIGIEEERMMTADKFKSNHRTQNSWWDNVIVESSVADPDIMYVLRMEDGEINEDGEQQSIIIIYTMERSEYTDSIFPKWLDRVGCELDGIDHFNVMRDGDSEADLWTLTYDGITYVYRALSGTYITQYETGNAYITTDGIKLVTDLLEREEIINSLNIRDTRRVLFDYYPHNANINIVWRIDRDLYISYNDSNFTVIKYSTEKKEAALFFQLRDKNDMWVDDVYPGVPNAVFVPAP
jgi:hypothetical protein